MYRKRCCPLISTWHDYHMLNICQCLPLCLSIAVSMSPAMTYVPTALICIHNNDTNLDSTLTQRAGSVCLASTNLLWLRDVFNALDVNVINLSKSSLDCHIWHPPAVLNSKSPTNKGTQQHWCATSANCSSKTARISWQDTILMGGVALIFSSDSHPLIFRVKSVDIFLHLPGLKQFWPSSITASLVQILGLWQVANWLICSLNELPGRLHSKKWSFKCT